MWITMVMAGMGYFLAKALATFFMTPVVHPFQPQHPKDQQFFMDWTDRYKAWWIRGRKALGMLSKKEHVEHYWSGLAPHLATQFDRTPGVVRWRYDGGWVLESDTISRHQLLRFQTCLETLPAPPAFLKSGVFFLSPQEKSLTHLGLEPYHLLGIDHHLSWMLQQTTPS